MKRKRAREASEASSDKERERPAAAAEASGAPRPRKPRKAAGTAEGSGFAGSAGKPRASGWPLDPPPAARLGELLSAVKLELDLFDLLERSDGLVRVEGLLPEAVAEAAAAALHALPASRWVLRHDETDGAKNTTQHSFHAAYPLRGNELGAQERPALDDPDPLGALAALLHSLLPGKRSVFSAARYDHGDHIAEHDDHALVMHSGRGDHKPVLCSRDVACIYYLTPKDWAESDGGVLVDLTNGKRYVPRFNSLVAFVVPRFHEVTAVRRREGRLARLSVFGWFLEEGDLYEYNAQPNATGHAKGKAKGNNNKAKSKGKMFSVAAAY